MLISTSMTEQIRIQSVSFSQLELPNTSWIGFTPNLVNEQSLNWMLILTGMIKHIRQSSNYTHLSFQTSLQVSTLILIIKQFLNMIVDLNVDDQFVFIPFWLIAIVRQSIIFDEIIKTSVGYNPTYRTCPENQAPDHTHAKRTLP